ncbi:hypothetical protein CHISP_2694 [Chitinispirillum alkaliphilum]|nr:hypothetical protein CHISP_2694 [Chitinispirillum alkaliphilum]
MFLYGKILMVALVGGVTLRADRVTEEDFFVVDKGYNYDIRFTTSLSAEAVSDILFEFEHVNKYTFDTEEVSLVSSQESSYVVMVEFSRLFYSFQSVFQRTRFGDSIIAELKQFSHNRALLPELVSSRSVYRVIDNGDHRKVYFNQIVRFTDSINSVYMRMIQGGVRKFKDKLLEYIAEEEL